MKIKLLDTENVEWDKERRSQVNEWVKEIWQSVEAKYTHEKHTTRQ